MLRSQGHTVASSRLVSFLVSCFLGFLRLRQPSATLRGLLCALVPADGRQDTVARGADDELRVRYRPSKNHSAVSSAPRPLHDPRSAHVFSFSTSVDEPTHQALLALLSPDERERARRFVHARDARRFAAGRGRLRQILGQYLGRPPREVRIGYGAHGKPRLLERDPGLEFNASASGELALVAVRHQGPVGVDVERVRPGIDAGSMVRRFFTAEEARRWDELPRDERVPAFFSLWTCKEALLKATGRGLALRLDAVEIALGPGSAALARIAGPRADAARWSLWTWRPAAGYAAALCVEGELHAVEHRDLGGLSGVRAPALHLAPCRPDAATRASPRRGP